VSTESPDEIFDDEIAAEGNRLDDDLDDGLDGDLDGELDEVGASGNRIAGARAVAVVEYVTGWLTDDSDAVEVEIEERGDELKLLVHADPGDMGRLIGRRGRVIQALRQVTRAAGAAEGVKATVDVAE
jgi:predicted RNA-binding protein YlqC (UPF0109 family)